MAKFNISVPNKFVGTNAQFEQNKIAQKINKIKKEYGTIIDEVATNSNVPAPLLIALIGELSDGDASKTWTTGDGFRRSGLFALSEVIGKQILARERAKGRMNDAELAFLRSSGDKNLKTFLSDDRPVTAPNPNLWWSTAATTGLNRISATNKQLPIDWKNPKIAIQTGAMWLGQIWDEIGSQVNNPLDKVLITMFYPYGANWQRSTERTYFDRSGGWLSGAPYIKSFGWQTNFTDPKQATGKNWLTGYSGAYDPDKFNDIHPKGSFLMIKRSGGAITEVFKNVLGKNGYLDLLTA